MVIQPLEWTGTSLKIVDQTKLPWRLVWLELRDYREVVEAIKSLRLRGAPTIGVAAAYGIAMGARTISASTKAEFLGKLDLVLDDFRRSRPTAVNLFYTIERMRSVARSVPVGDLQAALVSEAKQVHLEQVQCNARIARFGSTLIRDGAVVLTHCNAGPLAACGVGTALGAIFEAVGQGKKVSVIVDETRPLLQGARLTAWELKRAGIPVWLITDAMSGFFMKQGVVDCVIVGADRVAANGDVANKIGTYSLAVLAKENFVPFYVAAPLSSIDVSLKSGREIPIEQRDGDEVTRIGGRRIAPRGVGVYNPAFDITPAGYVTAMVTEKGIVVGPNRSKILKLFKETERCLEPESG